MFPVNDKSFIYYVFVVLLLYITHANNKNPFLYYISKNFCHNFYTYYFKLLHTIANNNQLKIQFPILPWFLTDF